jgi:alpha-tubulin suppressor-like RCC1 family protein
VGDFSGEISGLPPLTFGAGRTAKAIASGGRESCAILSDDALKCWGAGSDGQLGQPHLFSAGTTPEQLVALPVINLGTGRQAKSVDLNVDHVCAVLDNGTLKCWGYGGSGQLGLGSTDSKGLNDGDMGDALPPVYLGGRLAHQVATGGNHTCAILDDGTVKCWGYNGEGELGLGDTRARGDSGGELAPDTTVDLSF